MHQVHPYPLTPALMETDGQTLLIPPLGVKSYSMRSSAFKTSKQADFADFLSNLTALPENSSKASPTLSKLSKELWSLKWKSLCLHDFLCS